MKAAAATRIHGLDFLRSLAIIFVLCHHYQSPIDGVFENFFEPIFYVMWVGVDLFFVLSGFLIASQWFVSLDKDKIGWGLKKFYIKRFFRILPTYWIVLVLYSLQAYFLTGHSFDFWKYVFFIQNFYELPIFGVSWSLCVEEHFYIVFPFLSYFIYQKGSYYFVFLLSLVALGLTLYLRHNLWVDHVHYFYDSIPLKEQNYKNLYAYYESIYFPSYTRTDGLLFGVLLAACKYYRPKIWNYMLSKGNRIGILGLIILGSTCHLIIDKYSWASSVFSFTALALGFSCLLISACSPRSVLGKAPIFGMEKVAMLSYPMYLLFPGIYTLIDVLSKEGFVPKVEPLYFFIHILVVLICAQVLHSLVEKPFLNIRVRLLKKCKPNG